MLNGQQPSTKQALCHLQLGHFRAFFTAFFERFFTNSLLCFCKLSVEPFHGGYLLEIDGFNVSGGGVLLQIVVGNGLDGLLDDRPVGVLFGGPNQQAGGFFELGQIIDITNGKQAAEW